jgi:hypothetical protein
LELNLNLVVNADKNTNNSNNLLRGGGHAVAYEKV